ncbi:MAG: radical SAM/SPASM domain-containing protein [Bacteroidales bacterium]
MNEINKYKCLFSRVYNLLSIVIAYALSVVFRKAIVSAMPFSLSIEPTNRCQLSCKECPTGNKTTSLIKGEMDIHLYENLLSSIYNQVFYLNLYFQGEPLLNNQIIEMIRLARKYRMYVVLSTNAQLIDNKMAEKLVLSGLSKIIISMDGMTEESYTKYRVGGSLALVKKAIEFLNTQKKIHKNRKLKIIAQFLVNRYNEHEISDFIRWAKKNKVKPELKTMQIYHDYSFLPKNEQFSRYRWLDGNWVLKKSKKNRCFRIWKQCIVRYNGDLLPCCYDKENKFVMGNVKEKSLKELWRSPSFQAFRLRILKDKKSIPMCQNCTE